MSSRRLPPNQQLIRGERWPFVGERSSAPGRGEWGLEIAGLVDRPCSLSLEEFARLPQTTKTVDIHCVTRWSKFDVEFRGVLLADLTPLVSVRPAAKFLSFVARSTREHSSSLPLAEALELGTLLATHVGGEPIPAEHGGPIRGIVPGKYFYKSVKWIERLDFLAENRLGFWEATAGYHDHANPWREERYVASNIDGRRARQLIASKDFSGQDLRGIDCRQRDLRGLNAREGLLRDANFSNCQLANADFSGANLSNANFFAANLRDARFVGADLEGAELSAADLRGADFRGCSWFGTSFCRLEDTSRSVDGALFDTTTRFDPSSLEQLTDEQRRYVEERTTDGRE